MLVNKKNIDMECNLNADNLERSSCALPNRPKELWEFSFVGTISRIEHEPDKRIIHVGPVRVVLFSLIGGPHEVGDRVKVYADCDGTIQFELLDNDY